MAKKLYSSLEIDTIKTRNSFGHLSSVSFTLVKAKDTAKEPIVIITKKVLVTSNFDYYLSNSEFKLIRVGKGYRLFKSTMILLLSTFESGLSAIKVARKEHKELFK